MVRVIAGAARGRKLKTLDKETTKPTLDRVKEAMFSILMPYVPGARVLDLFSGNGSLGIEALSRGAGHCVFNDFSRECVKLIKENLETVGFSDKAEIFSLDFGELIAKEAKKESDINLILLDPPYGKGLIQEALRLFSEKVRNKEGVVAMCESSADDELPDIIGRFEKQKEKIYGTVKLTIFVKEAEK